MREVTIEQAMAQIDEAIANVKKLAQAGLWEAGLKIMGAAQRRLTDLIYSKGPTNDSYKLTGNLRASGYVRADSGVSRPQPSDLDPSENEAIPSEVIGAIGVELGFTASYGLYVHEDMEGRGAKFLENTIIDNREQIIEIVKQRSGGQ